MFTFVVAVGSGPGTPYRLRCSAYVLLCTSATFASGSAITAGMELRTASTRGSETNCRGSLANQLSGRRTRPADARRVSALILAANGAQPDTLPEQLSFWPSCLTISSPLRSQSCYCAGWCTQSSSCPPAPHVLRQLCACTTGIRGYTG